MRFNEFIKMLNYSKENDQCIYTRPLLLISIFAVLLAFEFILVSFSYHLICFATVPFLFALAILYKWFIGIWRSYSYSLVYIVIMPTASLVLAVIFGSRLREAVFEAVNSLFTLA